MWTKKRLLIWGKTYPEFSKSYYETVCTGAIDGDSGKLIRIYPITLRYMKERFRTYDWIEAEIERNDSKDFRPESYRINQDSIRVVDHIGTSKAEWRQRVEVIARPGNVFASVEDLLDAEEKDHTSIGLVRPQCIKKFHTKRRTEADRQEWFEKREETIRQKELFVDVEAKTKDLEFPPLKFYVEFTCNNPNCGGHDPSILEWGTYVLERNQRIDGRRDPSGDVISKLEEMTNPARRDVYFFLGNMMAHPRSFSIVGLFCPPKDILETKREKAQTSQMDLFSKM